MMKYLFLLLTGSNLAKMQAKHNRALFVFEKAQNKLDKIGDDLSAEASEIQEQIDSLQHYRDCVKKQLEKTDRTRDKIKAILN